MTDVEYKGFQIIPKPHELRDSHKWTLVVHLMRHNVVRAYYARNTYDSRSDAISGCLAFGRDIIDGRVPSISVFDLPGG